MKPVLWLFLGNLTMHMNIDAEPVALLKRGQLHDTLPFWNPLQIKLISAEKLMLSLGLSRSRNMRLRDLLLSIDRLPPGKTFGSSELTETIKYGQFGAPLYASSPRNWQYIQLNNRCHRPFIIFGADWKGEDTVPALSCSCYWELEPVFVEELLFNLPAYFPWRLQ